MLRVLYFGKSKKKTNKRKQIIRAFNESDAETLWLNPYAIKRYLGKRSNAYILKRIESFKPDLIFISSTDIPLPVLNVVSGKIRTVMYYVDPWRMDLLPAMAEWGRLVDHCFVTASGVLEAYRDAGIRNPVYATESCDKYDHRRINPLLPIWKSDVAFIGKAREDEPRVRIVGRLKTVADIKVYGGDWDLFGTKPTLTKVGPRGYARICGGAKVILGSDSKNDIEGYWSDRLYSTLGCGGFLVTNHVPGMEEFFENHKHLVWYRDEDECVSLIREYLSKPEWRRRIADQGYKHVHENFTFHHFVRKVINIAGL